MGTIMRDGEVLAWIAEHGSRRLRRCVAEGIKADAIYREERLALEAPGWELVPGDLDRRIREPLNATEEAFELLDIARRRFPEAKLGWLLDLDGDGEWVAVAPFLGRQVILRLPEAPQEGEEP